jgi:hypothetical protein
MHTASTASKARVEEEPEWLRMSSSDKRTWTQRGDYPTFNINVFTVMAKPFHMAFGISETVAP